MPAVHVRMIPAALTRSSLDFPLTLIARTPSGDGRSAAPPDRRLGDRHLHRIRNELPPGGLDQEIQTAPRLHLDNDQIVTLAGGDVAVFDLGPHG